MRILHISHTNISYDSRILKELAAIRCEFPAAEIIALGAELDNTTHAGTHALDNVEIKTTSLKVRKIKWLPKILRQISTVIEMYFRMRAAARDYRADVIHAHDTVALFIAVTSKSPHTKIIYDAHELESDRNGVNALTGTMIKQFEKWAWSSVDRLIVVGELIGDWYEEHIGKKSTTIILNSPISKKEPDKKTNYLRKHFDIACDRRIFIYVGALMPGRMVESYLNIFSQPDFPADIIFLGYGPLDSLISFKAKSAGNIHLHTAVAHDDVVSVVGSADVGLCVINRVSLSDYLSLPNKLFEYAYANVPSLVSDFPAMKNYSARFDLGWTTDISELAIEKAILDIVAEPELKVPDMVKLKEVSWDQQAAKLTQLYRGLM